MHRILIDVWSDFVCPFCYLAEPVLERVGQQYGERLTVSWRAFELRPDPVPTLDPGGEYLRSTWERAVYPMAEERGMKLKLPPVQPRSRLALRAHRIAADAGLGEPMRRAIFEAFFQRGLDIGEPEVLAEVASRVGVDAGRMRERLAGDDALDAVLSDQHEAEALGIRGVPAMLVRTGRILTTAGGPGALLLSGAQPLPVVRRAIERLLGT